MKTKSSCRYQGELVNKRKTYLRLITSLLFALAGVALLALLCSSEPAPVAAQEPPPFSVEWTNSPSGAVPWPSDTWAEAGGDAASVFFTYDDGGGNAENCFYLNTEGWAEGHETAPFWSWSHGVRIEFEDGFGFNPIVSVEYDIASIGDGGLVAQGTQFTDDTIWICVVDDADFDCQFEASFRVCFQDGENYNFDSRVHVIHGSYYTGDSDLFVEWTQQPPMNYCPDGTEALTQTVTIARGDTWETSVDTLYDALQVRYVITRSDNIAPSYLHGEAGVNGATDTFNEYTDMLTITVPATAYGVNGPVADLSVENIAGEADDQEFDLLSACILDATPSPYCPDGIEAVSQPLELAVMERWESGEIATGWDRVMATYYLYGRMPTGQAELNGWYYAYALDPVTPSAVVSFTIPPAAETDGGFLTLDGSALAELLNTGAHTTTLNSVCLQSAPVLSAPVNCNLTNHDFITDTHGWSAIWESISHVEEGNGACRAEWTSFIGGLSQPLTEDLVGPYRITARLRSENELSNTVHLTVQDTNFEYFDDHELTPSTAFETYQWNFYLEYPNLFSVQTDYDDIVVDWVCIEELSVEDGWHFPMLRCMFPTFDDHPDFSITQIRDWILWIAWKIGELQNWLICMIRLILHVIANVILDAIEAIGIEAPTDLSLGGLIAWLRETMRAFNSWLFSSLVNMVLSGRTLGEWLRDQFITLATWLWEDVWLEVIEWALDQAEAAGLISEDAINRIMWMFRNVDIWIAAAWDEAEYEFDSAILLLQETVNVFVVLLDGMRSGLTGEEVLDMGEGLGGFAPYLWRGVEFINETVGMTPLAGLNVVALGVMFWGLSTWTLQRVVKILESLV